MAQEYGGDVLRFLYGNPAGRVLLKYVAAAPWFSAWRARSQNTRRSAKKILPFVAQYGIDLADGGYGAGWRAEDFRSFNDFFTRQRDYAAYFADLAAAGRCAGPGELPAVADAQLSVYPVSEDLRVPIKETTYSLEELTGAPVSDRYRSGRCFVLRLELTDYHRYCFPDSGRVVSQRELPGALHTVRPVSEPYRVYSRNKRTVTVLETEHFGEVTQIEVGAMLVGHIVNHPVPGGVCKAYTEKGYFEFGGSTIVLLTGPEVLVDERLEAALQEKTEVHVRMGEPIGKERA